MTVWCSMRGWDKTRQRGVYQPFILSMQLIALTAITLLHDAAGGAAAGSSVFPYHALLFIPGTLLGTWFGLRIFHNITDRNFARLLAALLALSGIVMIG
ncbi:MAG: TSUP family transporter [Acetobacteraceae bacterium]